MARKKNTDKSNYFTIKEVANIVGKSQQSIYKRIKEQPSFTGYVKVIDGQKMLHKSVLSQVYKIDSSMNNEDEQQVESLNGDQTTQLIQLLQEQLKAKDKQIADLTEALKAEQILRATADQRIALLEDKHKQEQPQEAPEEPLAEDEAMQQDEAVNDILNDAATAIKKESLVMKLRRIFNW